MLSKKRFLEDFRRHGISYTQYQILRMFVDFSMSYTWAAEQCYEITRDEPWSAGSVEDYMDALMLCVNESLLEFVTRGAFDAYRKQLSAEKRRKIPNFDRSILQPFQIDFTAKGYRLFKAIANERGQFMNIRAISVRSKLWRDCFVSPFKKDLLEYQEFLKEGYRDGNPDIVISDVIPSGPMRLSRFEVFSKSFRCYARYVTKG